MSLTADQLHLFARMAKEKGLSSPVTEKNASGDTAPLEFPMTDVQWAYWVGRTAGVNLGGVASHGYQEFDCGALDTDRLQAAWDKVIARHDMLRATVSREGRFRVQPVVPPLPWEVDDLRALDEKEKAQRLEDKRQAFSHRVPDLSVWPVITLGASIVTDDFVRIHLSCDAVMADVYSIGNCLRELGFYYTNPHADLPAPGMTFGQYAEELKRREQTAFYENCRKYWQNRLKDFPAAPLLPVRENQPATQRFKRLRNGLQLEEWRSFKASCGRYALTPSVALYAAFAATIGQWASKPEFCLNVTVFNRDSENPAIEEVVGDFTATMLSTARKMRPDENFVDYARTLDATFWKDFEHSTFSGIKVLQLLSEKLKHSVLMPIVFTSAIGAGDVGEVLNTDNAVFGKPAFTITQTPQIWLDHQVLEEEGRLVFNWDVVDGIFDEAVLGAMFKSYARLIRTLSQPQTDWRLPVAMPLPEEQRLRREAPPPSFDRDDSLLHQGFLEQVRNVPEKTAIFAPDRVLTFGELFAEAHAVARRLREVLPKDTESVLVAVGLPKGWRQVAAVFGVLLTGAAYVPVDPTWPLARRSAVLRQGIRAVVAAPEDDSRDWAGLPLVVPGSNGVLHTAGGDALSQGQGFSPDRLAYVIFTSGTTGTPKGVMMTHRAAQNTIRDINTRFGVCASDSVFALSALSFDLSVYDIFGVLAVGGHLVLPEDSERRDPSVWLQRLAAHPVTIWNSVPTLWQMFIEYGEALEQMPRLALLSGDWVPTRLPAESYRFSPETKLVSLGGATEAAIWSIAYDISREDPPPGWKSIPYGRALTHQSVDVLHEDLSPCPDDVVGEIFIGGRGVALGYIGDASLTDSRFITHPRSGEKLYRTGDMGRWRGNGQIEFLGRQDTQVKINGFRIELGEIEEALLSLDSVAAAVAAVMPTGGAGSLVGYIVSQDAQSPPDKEDIRAALRNRLPLYMVPQRYVFLDRLPLTDNGKVDRKRLPPPGREESGADEKGTELEEQIRDVVAKHLGTRLFSLDDRFFDLGATSLLMVKIHRDLCQVLSKPIALIQLFEAPSVRALARLISGKESNAADEGRAHAEKRLAARASRRGKMGK
mgnify:CR=1 FL=1